MADKKYAKIDPALIANVGKEEVKRGLAKKSKTVKIDGARKAGRSNPDSN